MSATIVWALLTGLVTGGAWVAVVLLQRQHRLIQQQPGLLEDVERRLDELDRIEKRLAEVEERLSFAERLLTQRDEPQRLPPPAD